MTDGHVIDFLLKVNGVFPLHYFVLVNEAGVFFQKRGYLNSFFFQTQTQGV